MSKVLERERDIAQESKVLLRADDRIYLYSEIASVMQEKFALDPIWEDQKDENGIIHSVRTSESEDTFCEICDDVEEIMSKVFEKVDA